MLGFLVCFTQITLIGGFCLAASRWLETRMPALAANWLKLGVLCCSLAVLFGSFGLPRLWIFKGETESLLQLSQHGETAGTTDTAISIQVPVASLSRLLGRYSEFKIKKPQLQSQLIVVAQSLFAFMLAVPALRCSLGMIAIGKLLRSARSLDDRETLTQLRRLESRVQHKGLCSELLESPGIQSPCVCWLRPKTILVPCDFTSWTALERDVALAHELQHLARGDAKWRFISELMLSTFWLHPIAGLLRRQLIAAQELATDLKATEAFSITAQYRQGLSMLALRTDSQSHIPMFLEVSVTTNSVVRRIKMLKEKEFQKLPHWQNGLLNLGLVCAFTAALAWTAQAGDPDDTLRIASRDKAKPISVKPFSREAMRPDEIFGTQRGYFTIAPSELMKHEQWATILSSITNTLQGSIDFSLEDTGLTMSNLTRVDSNLSVEFQVIPEERRKNDDRFSASLGASAFEVTSEQPVDWASIWAGISENEGALMLLALGKHLDEAKEELAKVFVKTDKLRLISESKLPTSEVPTEALVACTRAVEGGLLQLSTLVPEEVLAIESLLEPVDDPMQVYVWVKETAAIGVGLDIAANGLHHIKIAIMPSSAGSAFLPKLKTSVKKMGDAVSLVASLQNQPGLMSLGGQLQDPRFEVADSGLITFQLQATKEVVSLNFKPALEN